MTEAITLLNHQTCHVERIIKILSTSHVSFDLSLMGSGKTYTTTEIFNRIGFKYAVVVCPASMEQKWKNMSKYGINLVRIISYQSLRSCKGCTPSHGLLNRYDTEDGIVFTPTDLLQILIQAGTLFIFDEAQNVKNKNDQWKACKAITTTLLKSGGISRMILLSGTPIDKEEHALNLMQMMGIIRASKLYVYNKEEGILRLYGAQELINYCKFIDTHATQEFLKFNRLDQANIKHNCYLLFQKILKPFISSTMPPINLGLDIDCKNGYFLINNKKDEENLLRGIRSLNNASRYNDAENTASFTQDNMASITKALMQIEQAKLNTFVRIAKEKLVSVPNCKIGIFVNYNDSLELLNEAFKDYNPIILQGKIPKEKRHDLVEKFQEQNLNHRILIANLQVCATGIDLDDKSGAFPRFAFASPNYVILNLQQLIYRFRRSDSKSATVFRFVYGKCDTQEKSILNALARKTNVLRDTLESQVEAGIKFPGEFEDDIELDKID